MLVSVGMGWSVLPHSMVEYDSSNLKTIQISGFNIQRSLGLCWNRHYTLSNAARALQQLLQDVAVKRR
jgi:DNA-binding transcriptional LysR family regulator